jgi:ABC-2 type transport system permease protein
VSNVFLISGNIIKRAFRNKRELAVLLLLPVAAIFITMLSSSPKKAQSITAGIVNLDKGTYGEEASNFIKSIPGVKIAKISNHNYISALKSSKINIAVIVPENFTDKIQSQDFVKISFKSNSNNTTYENIKQDINRYIGVMYTSDQLSKELSLSSSESKDKIFNSLISSSINGNLSLDYKIVNSKDSGEKVQSLLSAIGFSIMFIMVLIFTTIGTIMEDKKKLTLARIFTFKVREWEIVAGNLIGSLVLGILQLLPVIVVIKFLFDIEWGLQLLGIFSIIMFHNYYYWPRGRYFRDH